METRKPYLLNAISDFHQQSFNELPSKGPFIHKVTFNKTYLRSGERQGEEHESSGAPEHLDEGEGSVRDTKVHYVQLRGKPTFKITQEHGQTKREVSPGPGAGSLPC